MSQLKVFHQDNTNKVLQSSIDKNEIANILLTEGVIYRQWDTPVEIKSDATESEIIQAYQSQINKLKKEAGYQSVDTISLTPESSNKHELRKKFLAEHTHAEDEVRFFVKGKGLFSLHINHNVYEILCSQGDLISVPANTRHWFDMGPNPDFTAIRLFNNSDGWIAQYTDSNISEQFSRLT
ncbi:MAG: cupin [Bermanella sp.]